MTTVPQDARSLLEEPRVVEIFGYEEVYYTARCVNFPSERTIYISAAALRRDLGAWVDWPKVNGLRLTCQLDWNWIEQKVLHYGIISLQETWEIRPITEGTRVGVEVARLSRLGEDILALYEATRIFHDRQLNHERRSKWPEQLKTDVRAALLEQQRLQANRQIGRAYENRSEVFRMGFEGDMRRIAATFDIYDLEIRPCCEGVEVSCLEQPIETVGWAAVQPETVDMTAFRLSHKALEIIDAL